MMSYYSPRLLLFAASSSSGCEFTRITGAILGGLNASPSILPRA